MSGSPAVVGPAPERGPSPAGSPAANRVETRAGPTILVAGVVSRIEELQGLGRLERARWRELAAHAARAPADLVVVGRSATGADATAAIARLKGEPATAGIPVLHAADEAEAVECRADLCLASERTPGGLRRCASLLLERRRPATARSERLEALGRAAGGILHDLNNLLFAVAGHVELARRELAPDHPARARLLGVDEAVERAAELARDVLAFGREQVGLPRRVDLNAVVARVERLVQRAMGEQGVLVTRLGRGVGSVRADPGRIEQLLLNLVLDARDAAPGGARVRVETQDVEIEGGTAPAATPGRHALLVVSGEGTWAGDGAGATGAPAVRDLVEEIGATLVVDSSPGKGATFRVYLPCAGGSGDPDTRAGALGALPGETVLVVEESRATREAARGQLVALGYAVLSASSGEEALAVVRAHPGRLHLLLSSLVLPDLRARSLADRVAVERPGVRVLFIEKPIEPARLARAVRDVLDRD